ncbi:Type II/IV secretion system protein [compost metagenome]
MVKTVVRRITTVEDSLLETLRKSKNLELITLVEKLRATGELNHDQEKFCSVLKAITPQDTMEFSLEKLISIGVISKEDADYLVNANKKGRSIVIQGASRTGKTTLLGSLVRHLPEGTPIKAVEQSKEIPWKKEFSEYNIQVFDFSASTCKDLLAILQRQEKSLWCIDENVPDTLSLLLSLNEYPAIILNLNSQDRDLSVYEILKTKYGVKFAENVFDNLNVIRVFCSVIDGKYKVEVIDKGNESN